MTRYAILIAVTVAAGSYLLLDRVGAEATPRTAADVRPLPLARTLSPLQAIIVEGKDPSAVEAAREIRGKAHVEIRAAVEECWTQPTSRTAVGYRSRIRVLPATGTSPATAVLASASVDQEVSAPRPGAAEEEFERCLAARLATISELSLGPIESAGLGALETVESIYVRKGELTCKTP